MKKLLTLIFCTSMAISVFSQSIKGSWSGVLNVAGQQLPTVLHISEKDSTYSATMDSPYQGVKGIPVGTVTFRNSTLHFAIANAGIEYEGVQKNDSIIGTLKQNGMSFPLSLSRTEVETSIAPKVRAQDPKPPYPYNTEDVRFENKEAGITLAGALTWPKEGSNFPVAVLVSGSGPQDRNEKVFEHRPFLILSDHLTRNGIAVLRYDDRGVAESGGKYRTATLDDFTTDAAAAVSYMKTRKEIDPKKIGIVGHSEGGTIALLLAGEKNSKLAYIVSMAGVAIRGDSLMRMQRYLTFTKEGISEDKIAQNEAFLEIANNLVNTYSYDFILQNMNQLISDALPDSLKGNDAARTGLQQAVKQGMNPELKSLMNCNPHDALVNIKCPVFALNGDKDLQVPADVNLNRVKAVVKSPVTIKKYPDLNHLFQHCTTGLLNEYGSIEETISPEVLSDIAVWIKQVVR